MLAKGRLNRRVTIERSGTLTQDSWGETVEGSTVQTTRYAEVKPVPGTERFANAENAATAPTRFLFRYEPDLVSVIDRLLYGGRTYDIKSVAEWGNREGWEVLAVARAEGA